MGWLPNVSVMRNPAILSATSTPTPAAPPERGRLPARGSPGLFDACQIGVVLRAVLFVEALVATATLFVSASPGEWLVQTATVTGGAVPATLVWLVV
ncbi:MAG TPA: sensor histidine kinase, partial [Variovorax sp.]|nr:sensor histidine kinase [Variovorax sp.]